MRKKLQVLFICLCMLISALPLLFMNREAEKVSITERRMLAKFPSWTAGQSLQSYTQALEKWFNDNIGFREPLVSVNSKIRYHLFGKLAENSDMYLGPKGELNYAPKHVLLDYQRKNLLTETDRRLIEKGFGILKNKVDTRNIPFLYHLPLDKQSIYPEQFMQSVYQYGERSRKDQTLDLFADLGIAHTRLKDPFLKAKAEHNLYYTWGDPTHWTDRGAYLGYQQLMQKINEQTGWNLRILDEEDLTVEIKDLGSTLAGNIHEVDMQESISLKAPKAIRDDAQIQIVSDKRNRYYYNPHAGNDIKLLLIGDSYMDNFTADAIAESVAEYIYIRESHLDSLDSILDSYQPDFFVLETVERGWDPRDIANIFIQLAEAE